jgi:hypothetical protein
MTAAQYALPYPGEAETSADAGESDHARPSRPEVSAARISTPPDSGGHDLMTPNLTDRKRKPPVKATVPANAKLLVGREEAAEILSISVRSVDYLLANKQLSSRRIWSRMLIPMADLQKFVRTDHPSRLAS